MNCPKPIMSQKIPAPRPPPLDRQCPQKNTRANPLSISACNAMPITWIICIIPTQFPSIVWRPQRRRLTTSLPVMPSTLPTKMKLRRRSAMFFQTKGKVLCIRMTEIPRPRIPFNRFSSIQIIPHRRVPPPHPHAHLLIPQWTPHWPHHHLHALHHHLPHLQLQWI